MSKRKTKSGEYRQKSVVSGLSVKQIMEMGYKEFSKLSRSDLSKVVSRLASAGNKRLTNLEKKGLRTPAYIANEKSGGKFSVKGKTHNELRKEFIRARNFLNTQTSTVKGYEKFKKEFKRDTGIEFVEEEYKHEEGEKTKSSIMWELVDKLQEVDPTFYRVNYREVFEKVEEIFDTSGDTSQEGIDDMISELLRWKEYYYEENSLEESPFYPLGG